MAFGLGLWMVVSACAAQDCGWSRVDHRVAFDDTGMWNSNAYRGLAGFLTMGNIGIATWEGSSSPLGRVAWQGIDAQLIGAVTTTLGKHVFTRVRPINADNPCLWFQGGGNYSFPSGEAAAAAALVTPYLLEYGSDHPATFALLLFPLYVGVGRIKNQAHWQTDVLAGWAVGGVSGWYAHSLDVPLTLQVLPHGFAVGFKQAF